MTTKVGEIAGVEKTSDKFVRLRLDDGQRVDVPVALMEHIANTYQRNEFLVFVERRGRVFSYVQWVGSIPDAHKAVADGVLTPADVASLPTVEAWNASAPPDLTTLAASVAQGRLTAVPGYLEPYAWGRKCVVERCQNEATWQVGPQSMLGGAFCETHVLAMVSRSPGP